MSHPQQPPDEAGAVFGPPAPVPPPVPGRAAVPMPPPGPARASVPVPPPHAMRPGVPMPPRPVAPVIAPPSAEAATANSAAGAGSAGSASSGTGHPRVDAALEVLDREGGLPPAEQIAGYDAVHRTLQEVLATIDEGRS